MHFIRAVLIAASLIIASTAHPMLNLSQLDTPGDADSLAVVGDLAYVTARSSGIRIIDVSDLGSPVEVGSVDGIRAWDLAIDGGLLYVADLVLGLRIFDLSDPLDPLPLGSLDLGSGFEDIQVVGSLAYLRQDRGVQRDASIRVVDVSNPNLPVQIGVLPLPRQDARFEVSGDRMYVWLLGDGLRIFEVSDPSSITEIAAFGDLTGPFDVVGDLVYMGFPLRVIDFSDASQPVELGSHPRRGSVRVHGDRAYSMGSDLAVLDVSDPTSPELLGVLDFPGSVRDLEVDGTIGFAAATLFGFRVLDLGPPYFTSCEFGLYRNVGGLKKFFFDTNEDGISDFSHVFGPAESDVFVGNWDGTRDNIAIRRTIGGVSKYFINTNDDGLAEDSFVFGPATATGVSETIIGDWDGDGTDNVGFRKNIGGVAKYFLDHGDGRYDEESFVFGSWDWTPIVGDWDGPSVGGAAEHVGVVRTVGGQLEWLLDTDNDGAEAEIRFFFGREGEPFFTGDWNADGVTDVGVVRGPRVLFDYNTPSTRGGAEEVNSGYAMSQGVRFFCDGDADGDDDPRQVFYSGDRMLFSGSLNDDQRELFRLRFGNGSDTPIFGDFDGL